MQLRAGGRVPTLGSSRGGTTKVCGTGNKLSKQSKFVRYRQFQRSSGSKQTEAEERRMGVHGWHEESSISDLVELSNLAGACWAKTQNSTASLRCAFGMQKCLNENARSCVSATLYCTARFTRGARVLLVRSLKDCRQHRRMFSPKLLIPAVSSLPFQGTGQAVRAISRRSHRAIKYQASCLSQWSAQICSCFA